VVTYFTVFRLPVSREKPHPQQQEKRKCGILGTMTSASWNPPSLSNRLLHLPVGSYRIPAENGYTKLYQARPFWENEQESAEKLKQGIIDVDETTTCTVLQFIKYHFDGYHCH
jgi:hypothetical protein